MFFFNMLNTYKCLFFDAPRGRRPAALRAWVCLLLVCSGDPLSFQRPQAGIWRLMHSSVAFVHSLMSVWCLWVPPHQLLFLRATLNVAMSGWAGWAGSG